MLVPIRCGERAHTVETLPSSAAAVEEYPLEDPLVEDQTNGDQLAEPLAEVEALVEEPAEEQQAVGLTDAQAEQMIEAFSEETVV